MVFFSFSLAEFCLLQELKGLMRNNPPGRSAHPNTHHSLKNTVRNKILEIDMADNRKSRKEKKSCFSKMQ